MEHHYNTITHIGQANRTEYIFDHQSVFIMKVTTLISLVLCCFTIALSAQDGHYRGWVEERAVEPFSELEVSGFFNVYLRQGDTTMIEVASSGVPLHEVNIYNNGDKLVIDRDRKFTFGRLRRVDVYIQVVDLERIEMDGVGNIYTEDQLVLNRLEVECSGVGKAFLDLEVTELDIEMDGVGGMILRGDAERAYIENSSVGKVDAYDLRTQFMDIENTSIGSVRVFAEQELLVESNGLGSVHIRGNAEIKRMDVSGFGRIHYEDRGRKNRREFND